MCPAESSSASPDFGFPHTGPCPVAYWHRMRPPGLGSLPFHNVPSPTPRCEQTVPMSVNPRLLPAFPRRRCGRLTQLSITRLIRVHGYYGPLFCIFVQGHLSLQLTLQTRPPARSPNGRLGSGDLHPKRLMSVPACRLRPYNAKRGNLLRRKLRMPRNPGGRRGHRAAASRPRPVASRIAR